MINGRYSLLRYSANEGAVLEVSERFTENLKSVAGVAVPVVISENFAEFAYCKARITASLITSAVSDVSLLSVTNMMANIDVKESSTSAMSGNAYSSQDIYYLVEYPSDLKASCYMSCTISTGLAVEENLISSTSIVKNIEDTGFFAGDILQAISGGSTVYTATMEINVQLKPGSELRIDTENYTVLLDGENILYLQSGDWPELSRDLAYITIDSLSGGTLTGEVVYSERWL